MKSCFAFIEAHQQHVTCCVRLQTLLHLRVVGSCCAKFQNNQTFSYMQTYATTSNELLRVHVYDLGATGQRVCPNEEENMATCFHGGQRIR